MVYYQHLAGALVDFDYPKSHVVHNLFSTPNHEAKTNGTQTSDIETRCAQSIRGLA